VCQVYCYQIKRGDIIQITDEANRWYPCLLVVDEVKSWGVQAYLTVPTNDDEPNGNAFYRIENGKFEKVGQAVIALPE
jgi:hypothetical protein